ncbi:hypothetical protein [Adhaeribacter rhizoryzae]|uniref:Uncharacterized protein n=1 Tax=Adhaeribacter rhizoryzae TaxID=2607907 RepID=A0A5M6CY65_9BACT|nr:hypothetical protein [Adhaeribacter rhizoryzae]KAA5540141.1 hypothetical protein F0145_23225 [Adhaeribacter rhizoryzae]
MQENKIFWTTDENSRTKQILDLLELNYNTKDQSQYGISNMGKKPGSVDGVVVDKNRVEYFIEALNLQNLNKEYIQMHINKLESKYDSKGLKNKFLIVYCNIADSSFEAFFEKFYNYVNSEVQFDYSKLSIEKINSDYTNQRIIKTVHLRESIEVNLYHILLKIPK